MPDENRFLIEKAVERVQPIIDRAVTGVAWDGDEVIAIQADPPASPAVDDAYIVATGGTGAWAGQDGDVAVWDGAVWVFTTKDDQFIILVSSEAYMYIYSLDDDEWTALTAAPPTHNNLQGLTVGDPHPQYVRRTDFEKHFMLMGG